MTPGLRLFISAFTFVLVCLFGLRNAAAQQDCFDAINVCSSSYIQNTSFSGFGNEQEVQPGLTCLGNGEANSVWYVFSVSSPGSFEFQLNPINTNDDYDFALYDLTNDSCSGIAAGIANPVSCNYSSDPGTTGISSSGSGSSNGSSGANQNATLNVQSGEIYALLVSNFTASQTGYSLDFGGSSSIGDVTGAEPDSVSLRGRCNPKQISLFFNENIKCGSVSSNGSEFTVTGPENVTISNVSTIGCSGGRTDELRITFTNKIMTVGTYTITIGTGSDGNSFLDGCDNETVNGANISFDVEFIGPDLSISDVVNASCGEENGSAEAIGSNGTLPYSFWWNTSPNQTTATVSNLSPGNYACRITDDNGCIEFRNVTIQNNSPIDLTNYTVSGVSCNGGSNGAAEIIPLGGQTPYTIEWDTSPVQTGQNANNLPGGDILVTVTDNTGCEETVELDIPEPASINASVTSVNPDCGVPNGSAIVNASGGTGTLNYQWDDPLNQTTSTASGLQAGVYNFDVTDDNGCSTSGSVILTNNSAPNANIESTVPDCGQGTGQATAIATSGTAPHTYSWSTSPPQIGATATGLSEGDYFVTITDANGCVQIINVKIDTISPPEIQPIVTQPSCGLADGEIDASTINGIAPYTYTWSSSSNTGQVETGLAEGQYTVTVTDDIDCTATETIELQQLPPITETIISSVCEGEQNDFSFTTTSGATTWEWDFGDGNTSSDQNPTHTYAVAGNYDVTLTLDGGCMPVTAQDTAEVFQPPVADFTIDPEIPTTQTTVSFLYSGSGATNFLWDFGNGNSDTSVRPEHLYEIDGEYTVTLTVTDDNGCEDTTTQVIEVLLQPVIYLPNAFMPEGSTANKTFKGYGIGIVGAELSIFDRWGTLVYYSADAGEILTSGWDGSYKGKPLGLGAFAYKVKAQFYNNTSFEKLGTVTLIR